MKKKFQKAILLMFASTAVLSQIGCGIFGPYEATSCWPNFLNAKRVSSEIKFNGQKVDSLDTLQISLYFAESSVDLDGDVVTKVHGPERNISVYSIDGLGDESHTTSTIDDFPVKENQTKSFPIEVEMKADYYKVINKSDGRISYLPPMPPFSAYFGWSDDATVLIYPWNNLSTDDGAYVPSNQPVDLTHIQINKTDMTFDYSTVHELRPDAITDFPDPSPMNDLAIDFEEDTKKWTGTTTVKVLKNSDYIYHILTTITLTDGTSVFEQTLDDEEHVELAGCSTYEVDPGPS